MNFLGMKWPRKKWEKACKEYSPTDLGPTDYRDRRGSCMVYVASVNQENQK